MNKLRDYEPVIVIILLGILVLRALAKVCP